MCITEYDEALHITNERNLSRIEERIRNLSEMLSRGGTEEDLRKFHDASDEEIAEAKKMLAYA